MNATLSRLLLLVHGQDDTLDNPPKRFLIPGTVDADGIPTPECRGGMCNQGRAPEHCDCEPEFRWSPSPRSVWNMPDIGPWHQTEMVNELPFSNAPFTGMTSAEKRAERERKSERIKAGAVSAFWSVVGLAGSAAVLSLLMNNH